MKLALGSTVVFSILACSFLFHIGYQFAPLIELANAQALAQNDFDAGLANGDEVENLSRISLALRAQFRDQRNRGKEALDQKWIDSEC